MALSSSQLEAFVVTAKTRSFSKAALQLHITQSALSQRVMNLEKDLGATLIVRDPAGLRLTPTGEDLLRYCRAKEELELEFLGKLGPTKGMSGALRIAGFSSIVRSTIMPLVSPFVLKHSEVRLEIMSREMRDLFPLLASSEVDFIVTTIASHKQEIVCEQIGVEENVLVGPKSGKCRDVFFDHDADDDTTFSFFRLQNKNQNQKPKTQPSVVEIERCFLDEIYAIMDAVALGWGKAVLPRNLVKDDKRLKIFEGYKSLKIPYYLQYYRQPFYSDFQQRVIDLFLNFKS